MNNISINFLSVFKPLIEWVNQMISGRVNCRYFYFIGGRASGKTHQILIVLIWTALNQERVLTQIIRRTNKDVKKQKLTETRGTLQDFGQIENKDFSVSVGDLTFKLANDNLILLDSLNEEDSPPLEGGKIDLPIRPNLKAINTFYEEATQLHPTLIDQHQISTRSKNKDCIYNFFFAANPYLWDNWYVKLCNDLLPEDAIELEAKGYQFKYDPTYQNGAGCVVLRTNYRVNEHLSQAQIAKIESIKAIDPERYKVVGLGCSGAVMGAIYQFAYGLMKPADRNAKGVLYGGYDHGWNQSDSAAHLGVINQYNGIDILQEYSRVNSNRSDNGTEQQIDEVVIFFKRCYDQYRQPIKVFVDNAHLGDFFEMFNKRLELHGLTRSQIEFYPAKKQGEGFDIPFRIEVFKYMLSSGLMRIDKERCPKLCVDLTNCYYVDKKTKKELDKPERSHEYTHYLNSAEYLCCVWLSHFASLNAYYFTK